MFLIILLNSTTTFIARETLTSDFLPCLVNLQNSQVIFWAYIFTKKEANNKFPHTVFLEKEN